MNWSDIGIVLTSRKYGEGSAVVSLMTPEHGRFTGLVRGGGGKRSRGIYESGNIVAVDWRARIEEHLGAFKCELIQSHAALYLDDRLRLAGLSSACAVLEMGLPEREPYSEVYESLLDFIKNLETEEWLKNYVCWENNLLTALGFGLNLTSCAASGQTNDLIYVSPKSGRAVSKNAGEAYKDRLLSLPGFLTTKVNLNTKTDYTEVYKGLFLTGYFLDRNVFIHNRTGSPPARGRLVDQVRQNHIIDKTF